MTFFDSFISACNLRILMEHIQEVGLIPSFSGLFNRVFQKDATTSRGHRQAAAHRRHGKLSFEEVALLAHRLNIDGAHPSYSASSLAHTIQLSRDVTMLSSVTRADIKFTDSTSSQTDCDVIVSLPTSESREEVAGRIIAVFEHTRGDSLGARVTETFISFRQFVPLSPVEVARDPFRRYSGLNARSYRNRLSDELVILKTEDIVAHFAGLLYKMKPLSADAGAVEDATLFLVDEDHNVAGSRLPEYVAVLSLCRVRYYGQPFLMIPDVSQGLKGLWRTHILLDLVTPVTCVS